MPSKRIASDKVMLLLAKYLTHVFDGAMHVSEAKSFSRLECDEAVCKHEADNYGYNTTLSCEAK